MVDSQRRRALPGVALLAVLGVIAPIGCATDSTERAASPAPGEASVSGDKSAATPDPAALVPADPWARLGYRVSWVGYTATPRGHTVSTINVLGPLVSVTDSSGTVSGLSTGGGDLQWATQVGTPASQFVVSLTDGAGTILVVDGLRLSFLEARTGFLQRTQRMDRTASNVPVSVADALVYGTPDGFVTAHRVTNGIPAWTYLVGGPVSRAVVPLGPGVVGAVSDSGNVLIVDAQGRSLGRQKLFGGPGAELASSDDLLFVASRDQSLYAIERAGAGIRWRLQTEHPLTWAPTFHDGVVYCATRAAGLLALDARTGQRRWAAEGISGSVIGRRGQRLIVWNGLDCWLLDIDRGDVIEHVTLPGLSHLLTDAFDSGNLYAVEPSGRISRYQPR